MSGHSSKTLLPVLYQFLTSNSPVPDQYFTSCRILRPILTHKSVIIVPSQAKRIPLKAIDYDFLSLLSFA